MKQIDYDYNANRQKANWRRTMWNKIVERLDVKPRDSLVFYLAGHQDLDRGVAINKGFHPDNLIAAEKDNAVLREIRESGTLCVEGEFCDAVLCVAAKRKVHVVFGDFCGDLSEGTLSKINTLMMCPNLRDSVFAFNFQRGRDGTLGELRSRIRPTINGEKSLHRGGYLLIGLIMFSLIPACERRRDITGEMAGMSERDMWNHFVKAANPSPHSYKSGVLTFDSVVFINPLSAGSVHSVQDSATGAVHQSQEMAIIESGRIRPKTMRSASAILAHRTMRLNGTFPL